MLGDGIFNSVLSVTLDDLTRTRKRLEEMRKRLEELEDRVEKLESKENTSVEELTEQRQTNLLHTVRRLYKTAKDLNDDINAFSRYKSASAKMLDSLESIYDAENDELTI